MINGLYETHLFVEDLERSIDFYSNVLGLELCRTRDDRRTAFFWIGKPKQQMLGLWEKPKDEIDIRHFAFQCDADWILNDSVAFLKKHNLNFWNFLNDGTERPMVFAWMPAVAIYFSDPDGHDLEFIGLLEGDSKPTKTVLSYEDWLAQKDSI
ncbi:VOC family protein [Winogradskyella sp. PE311]|uniref:VOC family protein n=1 Tax=Winogradskyella sp. PE311 TaxID=3366943 RepID=UPI0039800B55